MSTSASRTPRARSALAAALGAVMASSSPLVWAGAWVQEQGQSLWIAKYLHSESNAYFDDDHNRRDFDSRGRSRQDQLNLYVEYGITENLTFVGNFYGSRFKYTNDTSRTQPGVDDTSTGLNDQEIGVRYRLNPGSGEGPWVGALQGLVVVPGYDRPKGEDTSPALGLGGAGVELRYSLGRGYMVGSRNAYVDMGAGVRLRTGGAADELRADFSTGVGISQRWTLIGEINQIQSLGNGQDDGIDQDAVGRFVANNYSLTKVQLSTIANLSPATQLQVGWQQPVMGRNTGTGGGPFLGFWWRY
ncbi:MAG: hypothetical protein ABW178_11945 [Pseudoxanthomonas sp.]